MKAGISIVLESDVGANFSGLVYRELRDGAAPSVLSYSAYWQNDNENPALEPFLRLLSARSPSRCLATCARRIFANVRSVAMNLANIGAISFAGSLIDCPFPCQGLGVGDAIPVNTCR